MSPPARRVASLLLGAAVVAVLLGYVGPATVLRTLAGANVIFVLLALASYGGFFLVRGVRWHRLLRSQVPGVSVLEATTLTAMGWVVSTFVPMKAGDVTRSAVVAYRGRRNVASVAGTVAVERALDLVGIAVASTLGLVGLALGAHQHIPQATHGVVVAWLVPPLALIGFILFARHLARRRRTGLLARYASMFLRAADELRERPRQVPVLMLLTLASTACQVGVFTFLFLAFAPGAHVALVAAGVPLFLLSFVVAVTPGNVGTYEAAFVGVFTLLGFEASALLPMAVAIHLLTITIVSTLGGAAFVVDRAAHSAPRAAAPPVESEA